MSDAKAEIEITASTARLPAALNKAMSIFGGFAGRIANAATALPGKIASQMGRSIVHGIAMRGLDMVIDQAHEVFDFNEKLTRFGIAARISGAALTGVGSAIRDVAVQTGVNANEVLRGARAYVDLAGAASYTTEKMSLIARASQASGSDINDMATVVYALQHSLSIPNNELENTIGGLINLSKDGAVHFNQMAQELIGLAPVYAQFGIKGREGAIQLASQLEVVRTGFGSASEAGTGLLRLYRSIPQHAKLFEGAGVQIFQKGSRTDLLTLGEILKNIKNSRLEKDRPALIKAFGRGEAERSYQLLDKLLNEYEKLEEAGQRNGVVQEDLATFTESAAGRMHIAIEKTKNAFAEALTPERVDQIVHGVETIAASMPGLFRGVSAVAVAFGAFAHAVARVKHLLTGDSKLEDTAEERDLIQEYSTDYGRRKMTPEAQTRAKSLIARDSAYNSGMADIMGSETDYGATDESIKKAIVAARAAYGGGPDARHTPEQLGAGQAASAYLADRKGEISAERYKRIEAQIDDESAKMMADALAARLGPVFKDAMRDGVRSAMQPGALGMEVRFDANSGGKAIADASNGRRR